MADPDLLLQREHRQLNPAKKFVSLLFHRGAEIPGDFPRLVGDGRLARVMRFADLAEVDAAADELQAVIRAWCSTHERS